MTAKVNQLDVSRIQGYRKVVDIIVRQFNDMMSYAIILFDDRLSAVFAQENPFSVSPFLPQQCNQSTPYVGLVKIVERVHLPNYQRIVSGIMPVGIVDLLEKIDIPH